jgi:hypothetical protein
MEKNGDKKSIRISLDIVLLYFHIVSKIVQAFLTTYDEIFQALAAEGDAPLPMPFMDPPPTVQPQFGPLGLSRVWQTEKTSEAAISI